MKTFVPQKGSIRIWKEVETEKNVVAIRLRVNSPTVWHSVDCRIQITFERFLTGATRHYHPPRLKSFSCSFGQTNRIKHNNLFAWS